MFDMNTLYIGLIFGSIGMGYFSYGKKAERYMFLLSGIILMIYPYFFTNVYYMSAVGILFLFFPFIIKL
ncbi:MAG: amino acid transport protein [Candidatus Gracilibacteria bacterium]|nr:amino acid transport protein [Candidatus Gracilibacteria bacterium]